MLDRKDNFASYSCFANNSEGSAVDKVDIHVLGEQKNGAKFFLLVNHAFLSQINSLRMKFPLMTPEKLKREWRYGVKTKVVALGMFPPHFPNGFFCSH